MAFTLRQKLTIIPLVLYWPALFILAHVPIPQLVYRAKVSDKILHVAAYLILAFLFWFAIHPDKKVNWRKKAVWWIISIIILYSILDESLQGYVGRSSDAHDFLANIAGAAIGMILFSFFSFWPAFLIVTAIVIFLLANLARANISELIPVTEAVFYFCAFGTLSLVWIRCMRRFSSVSRSIPKWLITALGPPCVFLAIVKLSSTITGRSFSSRSVIMSAAGIIAAVLAACLFALFSGRFSKKASPPTPEGGV
ncbi:MAG: VanZ family protein [Planctomycetota bacterium]|jgi:VanZ family protein